MILRRHFSGTFVCIFVGEGGELVIFKYKKKSITFCLLHFKVFLPLPVIVYFTHFPKNIINTHWLFLRIVHSASVGVTFGLEPVGYQKDFVYCDFKASSYMQ